MTSQCRNMAMTNANGQCIDVAMRGANAIPMNSMTNGGGNSQ